MNYSISHTEVVVDLRKNLGGMFHNHQTMFFVNQFLIFPAALYLVIFKEASLSVKMSP